MTLRFNGYKSEPLTLPKGIDQGCPLSRILFQYYNADLLDIPDTRNSEEAVTFMDDTLLLVQSKSLTESNAKVKQMMVRQGGGLDWSATHHCHFTVSKLWIMELTRKRSRTSQVAQGPGKSYTSQSSYKW